MSQVADFETLLEKLFNGRITTLRELLRPLDANQRNELFKPFKDFLKTVRSVCVTFPQDFGNTVTVKQLYKTVKADPQSFIQQWPKQKKQGPWLTTFDDTVLQLFTRLQMLQVALAPKAQVITGLKVGRYEGISWSDDSRYILNVGRALLDRPEPWAEELMAEFFNNFEVWAHQFGKSSFLLYQELRQQRPEWLASVQPNIGKVMALDGFWRRDGFGPDIEAQAILAGLDYELPREAWQVPVFDKKVIKNIFTLIAEGRLSRQAFLALILEKLQSPLRPSETKAWLTFYEKLAPGIEEIEHNQEVFTDLINAQASPVAQLAIKIADQRFTRRPELAAELLEPLAYALHHQVQVVANKAFALIKKLVKKQPDLLIRALSAGVTALATPHERYRARLVAWLAGFKTGQFTDQALAELQDIALNLSQSEHDSLADLLPQAEPDKELASDESAELRSWLEQQEQHPEQDSLWQQRVSLLEQYTQNNTIAELAVAVPDFNSGLAADNPFPLYESAEELATALQKAYRSHWSEVREIERLFASVVLLSDQGQRTDIQQQLLSLPSRDGDEIPVGITHIITQFLIQAWCGGKQNIDLFTEHFVTSYASLATRIAQLPVLLQQHTGQLLATPTQATGWLHPEVFAERYQSFPGAILDSEELSAALYRLALCNSARRRAWSQLESSLDTGDSHDQAVILTLAPEESLAIEVAQVWAAQLCQQPPDEPLYVKSHWTFSGKQDNKQWQRFQAANNRSQRLFHAALRARFALEDVTPWLQENAITLPDHPVPTEPEDDGEEDNAALSKQLAQWLPDQFDEEIFEDLGDFFKSSVVREVKKSQHLERCLSKVLLQVPPVDEAFYEQIPKISYSSGGSSTYPLLIPYTCAADEHLHHMMLGPENNVFIFPTVAQRLFEVGARYLHKPNLYSDLPLTMVSLGELPYVRVSAELAVIARLLVTKKVANRERGVDLLFTWLNDGRVTPQSVADALADLLVTTQQGFTYLDQALLSLCAAGAASQAIVQQALEQALASTAAYTPKNLSTLLRRLGEVLDENNSCVYDDKARAFLEKLIQSGKKSVAVTKAKELLNKGQNGHKLPPLVACCAALVLQ